MERARRQYMRVNESGSMVTFVVVGLVLAALVVGGIFAVQQQKEKAKAPSSTPVAVKNSSSPSKSVTPSPSPSQKPKASSPAPSQKPAPVVSRTPAPVAVVPKTSTAPLPETGPSDGLFSVVMLATFCGTAVAYARSIQLRRRLLTQVD